MGLSDSGPVLERICRSAPDYFAVNVKEGSVVLQILYKMKTASHLERLEETEQLTDVSHAVKSVQLCPDVSRRRTEKGRRSLLQSRLLLVTGSSGQATLFRFVKQESMNTIAVSIVFM